MAPPWQYISIATVVTGLFTPTIKPLLQILGQSVPRESPKTLFFMLPWQHVGNGSCACVRGVSEQRLAFYGISLIMI